MATMRSLMGEDFSTIERHTRLLKLDNAKREMREALEDRERPYANRLYDLIGTTAKPLLGISIKMADVHMQFEKDAIDEGAALIDNRLMSFDLIEYFTGARLRGVVSYSVDPNYLPIGVDYATFKQNATREIELMINRAGYTLRPKEDGEEGGLRIVSNVAWASTDLEQVMKIPQDLRSTYDRNEADALAGELEIERIEDGFKIQIKGAQLVAYARPHESHGAQYFLLPRNFTHLPLDTRLTFKNGHFRLPEAAWSDKELRFERRAVLTVQKLEETDEKFHQVIAVKVVTSGEKLEIIQSSLPVDNPADWVLVTMTGYPSYDYSSSEDYTEGFQSSDARYVLQRMAAIEPDAVAQIEPLSRDEYAKRLRKDAVVEKVDTVKMYAARTLRASGWIAGFLTFAWALWAYLSWHLRADVVQYKTFGFTSSHPVVGIVFALLALVALVLCGTAIYQRIRYDEALEFDFD